MFDNWRTLLKDVPGLGSYSARAIAIFRGIENVGIVDANVARIIRRIFGFVTIDPRAVIYQRIADEIAESSDDVRAMNFGLLDIGATICLIRPACDKCAFSLFCKRFGVEN